MTLLKTSVLSFIATVIKMISALVINKAISIYIGPVGLAMIGQFQSLIQVLMSAAQAGINSGLTKLTAEYGLESGRLPKLFSTATRLCLISTILISLTLLIFSEFFSFKILETERYKYIFIIFSITIFLFVLNTILLAILNGLKEIENWVIINIIQSLYSLLITSLLIKFYNLDGALIAMVSNQSIVLLFTLYIFKKNKIIKLDNFIKSINKSDAKKLGKYALMGLTSAIFIPLSHIIVRNNLSNTLNWEAVGYWQGIWYISTMYLTVVTTTLSTYYLPRLSEINCKHELRKELLNGYKFIIPVVIILSSMIYFLRDYIILLLFTESFSPMRELFFWQLTGDVLKISSWLFAYLMIAKSMTKRYIFTEIIFCFTFVVFSYILVNEFGIIGMSYSFFLNYLIYLIVVTIITSKEWRN